ncbi:MAG: hypothetical protein ABIQ74_14090 [Chitinophagales bacterium]
MRVLILAHDFPPLNTIGSRRPFSWYHYFPRFGIHPVVITKSWEEKSGSIREIASQKGADKVIIEETDEHTLIRVPLTKNRPDKLLMHYGASRFIFLRKVLTFLNLVFAYPFFLFDRNIMMYQAALSYMKTHQVDFILATAEPFILFKHAHLLSKKFAVPWIADFRDGWKLNHVTAQRKGIPVKLLRGWEFFFEKKYLASCKFITTVDPLLAERLAALHHKRAEVIYNGFEKFIPEIDDRSTAALPLILCHAGTVYPGHQVEVLLQAVKDLHITGQISPCELKIEFVGLDFFPEQLQRIMTFDSGIAAYLETTARLRPEQALERMQAADFLIVFTEPKYPVIPAKTYEYFSTGKPIIVILNDDSILAKLINDLKAGINLNSLEEITSFLLEKIEAKKNHMQLFNFKMNSSKAAVFRREFQAGKLAELLKGD